MKMSVHLIMTGVNSCVIILKDLSLVDVMKVMNFQTMVSVASMLVSVSARFSWVS